MVGSLALLGLQDAIVKILSSHVSLWQFQVLRGGAILVFLTIVVMFLRSHTSIVPQRFWAVALRSVFLATSMVFFFGGAPFLHLSQMAAGFYTFPLFVSLLAWVFLSERVGPRRVVAIIAGFVGTLLIIKPWEAEFSAFALMPVAGAVFYASAVLCTRSLCRKESPVTLAYAVNVTYVIYGILGLSAVALFADPVAQQQYPYLLGAWFPVAATVALLVGATAALNLASNIGLARAYQTAEPSWLAPFDYTYLIFAAFWGIVIFDHVPDLIAIVGMTMIAASGSFVAWRERQENRRRRANAHRALR